MNKADWRQRLRRARRALTPQQQIDAAKAIADNATQIPVVNNAQRIASYIAADGEIDCQPLIDTCWRRHQQVYLPLIQPDRSLKFAEYQSDTHMTANRYGIPEPTKPIVLVDSTLDVILMPLVGVDSKGRRLGMGGGFYDRSLAELFNNSQKARRPVLIGVAHDCQWCEALPADPWDVPLDWVLSPGRVLEIKQD